MNLISLNKINIFLIIFLISFVYGNNDNISSQSISSESSKSTANEASKNVWKNTAITSLFLLVIIISILAYIISINKRLKRRVITLEQICVQHGITKNKAYEYTLSSDDEYDELNPFLTKSDLDDINNDNIIELGRNQNKNENNNNKLIQSDDEYDDIDKNKGYQQENATLY